jgi:DNA-binding CsgD family transcriptional regulator
MPTRTALRGIGNGEEVVLSGGDGMMLPLEGVMLPLVELLAKIEAQVNAESPRTSVDEILLDTEVNGIRYLLVRMMAPVGRVQLSPREHEIVRMVAQGHPNKVIADVLNISSWTVCTHLRRIFAKLGVGSRAAMVAQLLESGAIGKEWALTHRR